MITTASLPPPELAKLPTALRAIAGASGRAGREVLHGEAGAILKACAADTKVNTLQRTTQRAINRGISDLGFTSATTPGEISVNTGVRGRFGLVWVRSRTDKPRRTAAPSRPYRLAGRLTRNGYAFTPEPYHWSRGIWIDIQEAVADVRYRLTRAVPAARGAIGLARQSWVQIADSLGIRLEDVPGSRLSAAGLAAARRAIPSTGMMHVNGLGREERRAKGVLLRLINRYPAGRKLRMDATLQSVMVRRVRYFEHNMERGVFNSMAATARAYPYLRVSEN